MKRKIILGFLLLGVLILIGLNKSYLTALAEEVNFKLGRVTTSNLNIRTGPGISYPITGTLTKNDIVSVKNFGYGPGSNPRNDLWLEIGPGKFIYSSEVQPVKDEPNKEIHFNHGKYGVFFMATIPVVKVHIAPDKTSKIRDDYPIVYGTLHKVINTFKDPNLPIYWYQIYDVQFPYEKVYVNTQALRKIPEDFIEPIHPEVPAKEKWIDFDLSTGIFTAYESEEKVYSGKFSYGVGNYTPQGAFYVTYKRLLSDMRGSGYLLPGVPAVTYFNHRGTAAHGTTWHNDWKTQRSHGCINLTPEDAWWIFRWLPPYLTLEDFAKAKYGAVWSNQPAGKIITHD